MCNLSSPYRLQRLEKEQDAVVSEFQPINRCNTDWQQAKVFSQSITQMVRVACVVRLRRESEPICRCKFDKTSGWGTQQKSRRF